MICEEAVDRLAEPDAPIAMQLLNAPMCCGQHWHGTLYRWGKTWFSCEHDHDTAEAADACARRRWFEHHG